MFVKYVKGRLIFFLGRKQWYLTRHLDFFLKNTVGTLDLELIQNSPNLIYDKKFPTVVPPTYIFVISLCVIDAVILAGSNLLSFQLLSFGESPARDLPFPKCSAENSKKIQRLSRKAHKILNLIQAA